MTILHAAVDAAEARDYGHCRELLAELSDEQVLAAKITLMAAAAQCDIIRYRPRAESSLALPLRRAEPCIWCGETDCTERFDHDRLNSSRETTWRERAQS